MRWPIDGEQPEKIYITQNFGENPEIYGQFGMKGHNGIDFRTRLAGSPRGHRYVDAALDGKVVEIGDQGRKGYGRFIRLNHNGAQTIYAHLKKFYVRQGQEVKEGQRIGLTDNTGFSTGPHLHFGFRPKNWQSMYNNRFKGYVDPLPFLRGERTDEDKDPEQISNWAKEAWEWARDNHLCDTTNPQDEITAEWVITMLYNSRKIK